MDRTFVYSSPEAVSTPSAFGRVQLVDKLDQRALKTFGRALLPMSLTQSTNYAWLYGRVFVSPSIKKSLAKLDIVTGRENGEPVVLIHGFASNIEAQWTPVIGALKKDYKVIAMDIRACGGSGKPHDSKKYGIEMMNDVARLLDHLKIDKAHIVGYSVSAG
jgi:pimeloyl-ACP methyl ester carboxylesterase